MKLFKNICAIAVLATIPGAAMSESVGVQVIGTIKPVACTPVISNDGNIDYGIIPTTELNANTLTQLGNKQLTFTISCDAPTWLALKAVNGRPGSAAGVTNENGAYGGLAPTGVITDNGKYVVGLGMDGDKKIGGYNIMLDHITTDGDPVNNIYKLSSDATGAWKKMLVLPFYLKEEILSSWTTPSGWEPKIFTNMSGTLNVQAYINKASELDLKQPIKLDGQTTIELVYL
ncbi:DUF1120 domain-containing protein [Erwinia pyrifoliae]|uniref:DUF1120 domain-containing protein n=1 Tax=Erwinia pyrifoliae TaxID=79967 RepID=A0ABY5XCA8_ERWPY|nr:DUF1120 domain-containing protein [Erwinia pyrifoliae]AUX72792.1 DUF1120 domain-containing protein [Erwinia pyrifoliae]MCA8876945.1 DUF1120 domain-containing protein [Erwinia pyrifoliae]MCT2387097.1 DUF1120 domain-containing protein [Erwinia pyrifoliae]MCU8587304.1 DUF1120 domain-containing protein [Erwinia pyrifoliae]UWS31160.1 DUF1120 domain-containing protein [Erwinia pyrifoliae]